MNDERELDKTRDYGTIWGGLGKYIQDGVIFNSEGKEMSPDEPEQIEDPGEVVPAEPEVDDTEAETPELSPDDGPAPHWHYVKREYEEWMGKGAWASLPKENRMRVALQRLAADKMSFHA